MNKLVLFGAAVLLCLAGTSCHNDDPVPAPLPQVQGVPNTLSGIVTDKNGAPINGATIKIGSLTATTNTEGVYNIDGVAEGNYTITASAAGKITAESAFSVPAKNNLNLVWNVMLASENTLTLTVDNNAGGAKGNVVSDAVEGNTKGEINIGVDVPEDALTDNTTITITPIYTEQSNLISRASSETMLIGAVISTANGAAVTLSKDINVSFKVDSSVSDHVVTKQFVNNSWQVVENEKTADGVVIKTRNLGALGLFFNVTVTETASSEALVMNPSEWDNLYGSKIIHAGVSTFTYKLGSEYNAVGANSLEALLIERLAALVGPKSVKVVNGEYPININIPIGTGLRVSGRQAITTVKVTSRDRSAQAKKYGTVTVTNTAWNRDHNGGGSGK